jgi:hypothetical protein
VSLEDGSRAAADGLEDRAAMYTKETYVIRANSDFRVFKSTEDRFLKVYEKYTNAKELIPKVVRKWYAQHLIETVLGAEQVRDSKMWSGPCIDKLTSTEALTGAVMAKYALISQMREEIEISLGLARM